MLISDALGMLEGGRPVRGSIELDDRLVMWTAWFIPPHTLTIVWDETRCDEPIPFALVEPDSDLDPRE